MNASLVVTLLYPAGRQPEGAFPAMSEPADRLAADGPVARGLPEFRTLGLYYALLLILEKLLFGRLLQHLPDILRHLVTLLIVAFGWGIFYYTDMDQWLVFLRRLFLWSGDSGEALRFMLAYIPLFYIACFPASRRPIRAILRLRQGPFAFLEIPWLVLLFLLCTAALVSQGYNPFIYFRF